LPGGRDSEIDIDELGTILEIAHEHRDDLAVVGDVDEAGSLSLPNYRNYGTGIES
jgi:hypothetical protein